MQIESESQVIASSRSERLSLPKGGVFYAPNDNAGGDDRVPRFARDCARVCFNCGAIANLMPTTMIIIHNGGVPISPGELPDIFDPLIRGSSADRPRSNRPGSIGMGLYIAREVAESHHGTIEVISNAEHGTSFTICLPRESVSRLGQPILDAPHIDTM